MGGGGGGGGSLRGCGLQQLDLPLNPPLQFCSPFLCCFDFPQVHGALVVRDGKPSAAKVSCKESADRLFIPEKENACAHGDANLAVDDFMKRSASAY